MGHIRDLPSKKLGVDVARNFEPEYVTSSDKRKLVKELREAAESAERVWLATDEDREGEAISWHLLQALDLDEAKTSRIVFHEITKSAIQEAIKTPRRIDQNLVDAQQARRILDRLVGFELSPLLWRKVMPKLSAGRVQSVATRLIVDRENEIKNFVEQDYFKITAEFQVKESVLKAEGTDNIAHQGEARAFLQDCVGAQYKVEKIEKKPARKSPSPAFTTSTLQQEASRRLGFSVSKTMLVAQQLYENGLITYMRTDSVVLSDYALNDIKKEIISEYGEKYYKRRKFSTQSKGAQEAHEAIRPTYMNSRQIEGNTDQQKLYSLIHKRTLASQMSDAILERTTVTIDISSRKENLIARAEVITFAGYLMAYDDNSTGKESIQVIPPLHEGEFLELNTMTATQRYNQPPARYNEAMLVRKLEELGIGRPSTYAPIISTIQKRKYVEKLNKPALVRMISVIELTGDKITEKEKSEKYGQQKGKLFPTDIGIIVNDFLMKYFEEIMDYNFTAIVVEEFDKIAVGQLDWRKMIQKFYFPFHEKVEETGKETPKFTGSRYLGIDPETGRKVFARLGRYGPMIQIGEIEEETKPLFASLPKNMSLEKIELAEALKLFEYPRKLGEYEGDDVFLATGRYGPYVKCGKNNYSLGKGVKIDDIDITEAINLIRKQNVEKKNRIIKEFSEDEKLKVLNGKYGPYISCGKKNYKIPAEYQPEKLTLADCRDIMNAKVDKPKRKGKR